MTNTTKLSFILKFNGKDYIFRENDLLKLGTDVQTIPFIRTIFQMIDTNKDKVKEHIKNLPANTTINSIFNNVAENENVFEQIINIAFRHGIGKSQRVVFVFSGYNYNPQTEQLRFYLNRQFIEDYLKYGKYVKTRKIKI